MSNTDKYAVLGNPIEHSMSPLLHEFFAEKTSQDLTYGRILVETGTFEKTVRDFFKSGGRGCNVTVPCKLDAYKLADSLSDYAKAAGAVNTLKVMEDGSIYGDNTDGRGLVYDLKRLSCPLTGARILIIGAGGAAKGILLPIINEDPKEIVIANRTVARAQALASLYPDIVKGCGFAELEGSFDLIINASSSSLSGDLPPVNDEIIASASAVYDLMYSKTARTTFTDKAQSLNVQNVNDGFGMLIGQAILSFELWRGVKPDFDDAIKKVPPMLKIQIEDNSPFKEAAEAVIAYIDSHALSFENDLLLKVGQKIVLELSDDSITPLDFEIDLFRDRLLWRLAHSGKNSEAVCRAVIGKTVKPLVFDATAGLGRESIILQSAGCQVYMFERNPVIWLLLKSAMTHAENNTEIVSSLKNGLPHLTSLGSVAEQLKRGEKLPEPDVIYYDPMFPQRSKSALVKKDMRVFHEIVGFDQDTTEYANFLLTVAKHHMVVKRPANEPPLELNLRRSSFVDGKACRFDCYFCGS